MNFKNYNFTEMPFGKFSDIIKEWCEQNEVSYYESDIDNSIFTLCKNLNITKNSCLKQKIENIKKTIETKEKEIHQLYIELNYLNEALLLNNKGKINAK